MNCDFSAHWGWHLMLDLLKKKPESIPETLLQEISVVTLEDDTLYLYAPNPFLRECIVQYQPGLAEAASEIWQHTISLVILDSKELDHFHFNRSALLKFNPVFESSFDSFQVGLANRFAHAAACAVAKCPDCYNPLVIYGESGTGKTRLVQAICSALHETHPHCKIAYTDGDSFVQDLITSIKNGHSQELNDLYRQANVLILEDIQFLTGKSSSQEELYHVLKYFDMAGKQVILTCDCPISELPHLERRLNNNLRRGLIADIRLDYDTKVAIALRLAAEKNVSLTEEEAKAIAATSTSGHDIRGAILRRKLLTDLNIPEEELI